tara:strand:+ start:1842 stop:2147 length:306 start_codon:yes stop_codon:yes gene_type:complete
MVIEGRLRLFQALDFSMLDRGQGESLMGEDSYLHALRFHHECVAMLEPFYENPGIEDGIVTSRDNCKKLEKGESLSFEALNVLMQEEVRSNPVYRHLELNT